MTLNEMKLRLHKPSATFPPTIKTFFAVDEGLRISPNSLKTWWPRTELNRRRQPFQGCSRPELSIHYARLRLTSLPLSTQVAGPKISERVGYLWVQLPSS